MHPLKSAASSWSRQFFHHLHGHSVAPALLTLDPSASIKNSYLSGGFAPVQDELNAQNLSVRGRIPDEIRGIYMRNGPNPAYPPITYTYPFDGDGMIHAIYFEDGRVSYRNRFILTAGLKADRRAGRTIYGGLMHPIPPDPAFVQPDGDPDPIKNTANINIMNHAGRFLALWEGGLPYEINKDLVTIGEYNFDGKILDAMTAHPRVDPRSGEMLIFRYTVQPPYLTYSLVDRAGALLYEVPVDIPAAFMIHDFAVTAKWIVFFLCPAVLDVEASKQGAPLLQWQPQRGTRIIALDRSRVRKPVYFEVEPFFVFHFMNAWEDDDGNIIIFYVQHRALTPQPGEAPCLWRATLNLNSGTCKREQVDDRAGEFPRIDPRLVGLPTRYGWLPVARQNGPGFSALARYDLRTGFTSVNEMGNSCEIDEPVFVERPGSTAEGDGWIMTYVYNPDNGDSKLLILDALSSGEEAVAEVVMPRRIPHGFHGSWIAANRL
jgi:carotenoid cleavage dioxygenase-like enzyme